MCFYFYYPEVGARLDVVVYNIGNLLLMAYAITNGTHRRVKTLAAIAQSANNLAIFTPTPIRMRTRRLLPRLLLALQNIDHHDNNHKAYTLPSDPNRMHNHRYRE